MTFEERREKVRRSIQELAYSVECMDRQIKRDPNWQQWWPKTPEFESTSPNLSEARQ